jgi:hypothetical protein
MMLTTTTWSYLLGLGFGFVCCKDHHNPFCPASVENSVRGMLDHTKF